MARVAAAPLTDAACDAAGNGWLLSKGYGWWDGNYLNTLYNHHQTPELPPTRLHHLPQSRLEGRPQPASRRRQRPLLRRPRASS